MLFLFNGNDFFRGYHWNYEVVKRIRNVAMNDIDLKMYYFAGRIAVNDPGMIIRDINGGKYFSIK